MSGRAPPPMSCGGDDDDAPTAATAGGVGTRAALTPYLASVLCGIRLCLRGAVDDDDKDEVAVVPPRCPQAEPSFTAWSSDAVAWLKLPRASSLRTGEQPM